MTEPVRNDEPRTESDAELRRTILRKSMRRMRAEHRSAENPIAWIASFGVVGWTVVVPTLLGLFVGRILDDRIESSVSFTITLLVAGAFVGLIGAWQWVDSETRRGRR